MTVRPSPSTHRQVTGPHRAQLVSVLRKRLFSDQAVGMIEPVKSAYDTHATEVEVRLKPLHSPETTAVTVRDNEMGMARQDIKRKRLSPTADHREQL